MSVDIEVERVKFETYILRRKPYKITDLSRNDEGPYSLMILEILFDGWLAAKRDSQKETP